MATIGWERDLRKQVERQIKAAAVRGVADAADALKTDAGRTVPHDRGTLQGSASVSVDAQKIEAAVAYDTPYAVRQHEDTRLRHPDPTNPRSSTGRRAKWLQRTLQENQSRYRDHIAAAIRNATGG